MSNKAPTPNIDPVDQGALFSEEVIRQGTTEPTQQHSTGVRLDVVPDGTFPEPPAPPPAAEAVPTEVHDAVVTANRRKGQLGKHSPLERTGSYSADLKPGDVLPDFGIVTKSNFLTASQHAANLDAKRQR